MTDLEIKTIEKMEKYGGVFVKALAVCFRKADPINSIKLKVAFSDYRTKYAIMAYEEVQDKIKNK